MNHPVKIPKSKKRSFSGFTYAEAFKQLNLVNLLPWNFAADPIQPSDFFQERIRRLEQTFNLQGYEESKKLLIDAICEEAIITCHHLRIWKGAQLEGDLLAGYVDYLVAESKGYLDTPLLCIIEAKRDDFEKGIAQCLVEMQVCQQQNLQSNRPIDSLGITTNGTSWQFYKLAISGQVYESSVYSVGDMPVLLGRIRSIFELCQRNLLHK